MKRKEGYYWVKINEKWEIAFYNVEELAFERHMDDSYIKENEFDEINEEIIEEPFFSSSTKEELVDCIRNLMGVLDTPVSRFRMKGDFVDEVRKNGRFILEKNKQI